VQDGEGVQVSKRHVRIDLEYESRPTDHSFTVADAAVRAITKHVHRAKVVFMRDAARPEELNEPFYRGHEPKEAE
jgi:hypothetical protein